MDTIPTRRAAWIALRDARGPDDAETVLARSNLAIALRNAGRFDEVEALFPMPSVCACLAPAEAYVRGRGVRVVDVSSPWSKNCRHWVTFDGVVLDAEGLIARLALPPSVTVHTHRGTHDGMEHGLVCDVHHDALIGLHPDGAGGGRAAFRRTGIPACHSHAYPRAHIFPRARFRRE